MLKNVCLCSVCKNKPASGKISEGKFPFCNCVGIDCRECSRSGYTYGRVEAPYRCGSFFPATENLPDYTGAEIEQIRGEVK